MPQPAAPGQQDTGNSRTQGTAGGSLLALASPQTAPSRALERRGWPGGQPGLLQIPCPPGHAGGQLWPQPVVHLHLLLG